MRGWLHELHRASLAGLSNPRGSPNWVVSDSSGAGGGERCCTPEALEGGTGLDAATKSKSAGSGSGTSDDPDGALKPPKSKGEAPEGAGGGTG